MRRRSLRRIFFVGKC